MHKYSSNVVEKCLERSEEYALNKFIDEVSFMGRVAGNLSSSRSYEE
jgi:hypothetical protein